MSRSIRQVLLASAGAALVAGSTLAAPISASAPASLRVEVTPRVRVGEPIVIRLAIRDSTDLGGYETNLLFDTRAAHFSGLAQTRNDVRRLGRDVMPLGGQEVARGVSFGFYSCPARDCVTRAGTRGGLGHRASLDLARIEVTPDRPGVLEIRLSGTRFVDSAGGQLAVSDDEGVFRVQVGSGRTLHSAPLGAWTASPTSAGAGRIGSTLTADLDEDGIVGHSDAMDAAHAWAMARIAGAPCGSAADPRGISVDLDGDGCVDVADLQTLASRYSDPHAEPAWAPGRHENRVTRTSAGPRIPSATAPTSGITFTVDSTGDQPDAAFANGICATTGGVCTLRAAIEEANRVQGGATIAFAIVGGAATKTITLASTLPPLRNLGGPVVIDGYTQAGASPNTDPLVSNAVIRIEITGPGETNTFAAMRITSAENTVRGLAIYRMWRDIWLDGPGAHHNAVVGSFLGTNAAGTYDTPDWVRTSNGAVMLDNGAHDNQIGRPVLADRNVVSGGPASGVYHTKEGTRLNLVQNNIIGLSPSGTARLGNELEGIDYNFGASDNLAGGTGPLERNVSSGNDRTGGEASHGTNTVGNRFVGNFVGTDTTGTRVFSYTRNQHFGIHVEDGVGDTEVTDNVICGNTSSGVRIDGISTRDTLVARNRIGVTLDGTAAGNATSGIRIVYRTTRGLITENLIAYNPRGIEVRDADNDRFTFSRNSIWGNTGVGEDGLGIDLHPRPGVNQNDPGDADSGANEQLDFPVLGTATTNLVTGTACAGCTVEIFEADRTAGQYGSGQTFVGSAVAGGAGSFAAAVSGLTVGDVVTSTATDAQGNTSEFSLNVAVGAADVLAADSFTRTVTDGWGTADAGGTWSTSGAVADFDVNGSVGLVSLPAASANRGAHLGAVNAQGVEVVVSLRSDDLPVGGSLFGYAILRRVSNGNEYRLKLRIASNGQVYLQPTRVVAGAETGLGGEVLVAGLVVTTGDWLRLRGEVTGTGPTTLRLKAWLASGAEPAGWATTATDTTAALQTAGGVGLRAYRSSGTTNGPMTVRFDDLQVSAP